jgi:hypothetical protein
MMNSIFSGRPLAMSQLSIITINRGRRWISQLSLRLLVFGVCILSNSAGAWQPDTKSVIQSVDDAEIARENTLNGYTVTERYSVVRNDAAQPAATRVVKTVYTKGQGKVYTEISRTGSSTLQKYLLDTVLQKEQELSKGDDRKSILVTSANYAMEQENLGESISGRNCLVFKLSPKKKSPYLVEGRVWVDSQNYHLVRVEGLLSAKPSFWAGHPKVTRDYQDIQGFALATNSKSESNNLFWGTTVVNIQYEDYHVTP